MKFLIFSLFLSCSNSLVQTGPKDHPTVIEQDVKLRVISGFFLKGKSKLPIKNQVVILKNHNNQKMAETKTNADGSFQFKVDIGWGPYSVYLESEDYHKLFNLNSDQKDLGIIAL